MKDEKKNEAGGMKNITSLKHNPPHRFELRQRNIFRKSRESAQKAEHVAKKENLKERTQEKETEVHHRHHKWFQLKSHTSGRKKSELLKMRELAYKTETTAESADKQLSCNK